MAGRTTLLPWLASGIVAVLVYLAVPGPWYVAAGAVAGLATALLTAGTPDAEAGA